MKTTYHGGIKFMVEAEALARCRPRTVKRLALAIAQVLKETGWRTDAMPRSRKADKP